MHSFLHTLIPYPRSIAIQALCSKKWFESQHRSRRSPWVDFRHISQYLSCNTCVGRSGSAQTVMRKGCKLCHFASFCPSALSISLRRHTVGISGGHNYCRVWTYIALLPCFRLRQGRRWLQKRCLLRGCQQNWSETSGEVTRPMQIRELALMIIRKKQLPYKWWGLFMSSWSCEWVLDVSRSRLANQPCSHGSFAQRASITILRASNGFHWSWKSWIDWSELPLIALTTRPSPWLICL